MYLGNAASGAVYLGDRRRGAEIDCAGGLCISACRPRASHRCSSSRSRVVSEEISGAADGRGAALEGVCVDHRRADISVSEKLLDGPNVVAVFEEVGREGMAKRVARGPLRDASRGHGPFHRALEHGFVEVVTTKSVRSGMSIGAAGGKDPMPRPLSSGLRTLSLDRVGELDPARPVLAEKLQKLRG